MESPFFSSDRSLFDRTKSIAKRAIYRAVGVGQEVYRPVRYIAEKTSRLEPYLFGGVYFASRIYGTYLEARGLLHGVDLSLLAQWSAMKVAPLPLVGIYGSVEGTWSAKFGKSLDRATRKAIRFYRTPVSESMRTASQVKRVVRRLYGDLHETNVYIPRQEYSDLNWLYDFDTANSGSRRVHLR